MTTQPEQEEFEATFELDVIAHAAGKCSFPLLALCSAEEQRVKSIVRSEKSKSYQQGREEAMRDIRDDAEERATLKTELQEKVKKMATFSTKGYATLKEAYDYGYNRAIVEVLDLFGGDKQSPSGV